MFVIVVSSCTKVFKKAGKQMASFHFSGVFNGTKIKEIIVEYSSKQYDIEKNKEYLIHLRLKEEHSRTLYGKVNRLKALENILA